MREPACCLPAFQSADTVESLPWSGLWAEQTWEGDQKVLRPRDPGGCGAWSETRVGKHPVTVIGGRLFSGHSGTDPCAQRAPGRELTSVAWGLIVFHANQASRSVENASRLRVQKDSVQGSLRILDPPKTSSILQTVMLFKPNSMRSRERWLLYLLLRPAAGWNCFRKKPVCKTGASLSVWDLARGQRVKVAVWSSRASPRPWVGPKLCSVHPEESRLRQMGSYAASRSLR